MNKRQILVIEDDPAIRAGVVDVLRFKGFFVLEAANGRAGLDLALTAECDLVLLDLILPGGDGLEILQKVRTDRPTLPVIILAALGSEHDRIRGLQLGADDYVVKPFSVQELIARVEAVLRRSPERPSDVTLIDLPTGVADLARREIRYTDGGRAELSEREGDLLRYLAIHAGRAITREEMIQRVWRLDPRGIVTRTIDMHVARLRDKLRDDPTEPRIILTVRGKGYMFATGDQSAGEVAGA